MIRIGPSAFSKGGVLRFGYYAPSPGDTAPRLALFVTEGGELEYRATTNLPEVGALPSGFVHLKGWSENEGVPEALVAAGVVRLTGAVVQTGRAVAQVAELTDAAIEELEAQSPPVPPLKP